MGNPKNPRNNSEGYPNPTAYEAIRNVMQEEYQKTKSVTELVAVIKYIADKAGFEISNRITFRDKKTGLEYR